MDKYKATKKAGTECGWNVFNTDTKKTTLIFCSTLKNTASDAIDVLLSSNVIPSESEQIKQKLINDQQNIIDENLAYLVSTDYYQGRNEEHIALGFEPVSDINEVLLKRQDSRQVIHAARLEIKLLNGETE